MCPKCAPELAAAPTLDPLRHYSVKDPDGRHLTVKINGDKDLYVFECYVGEPRQARGYVEQTGWAIIAPKPAHPCFDCGQDVETWFIEHCNVEVEHDGRLPQEILEALGRVPKVQ